MFIATFRLPGVELVGDTPEVVGGRESDLGDKDKGAGHLAQDPFEQILLIVE